MVTTRSTDVLGLAADTIVRRHAVTGQIRFIGSRNGSPITAPAANRLFADPVAVARGFLDRYGSGFGLRFGTRELSVRRVDRADGGRTIVRFQQMHHGVPVLAGDLVVDVDSAQAVRSASGEVSPGLTVPTVPAVTAARATRIATRVKGGAAGKSRFTAAAPALWIYDSKLMGTPGPARTRLAWRTEVTSRSHPDMRELVLVDAQTGEVLLHFNQVASAKNRVICDARNLNSRVPCTAPFARVEGGAATGIADVDLAYLYGGGVYDFYKTRFNRDSIDNRGMPLVQTVRYCPSGCPFQNAFWNGQQMVYGPNYASGDDVVGHELTHGVTEHTSGLFYWFQSGAINESLSDVFGELYDLTNGRGNDAAAARWLMGEDLPIGAIRSMRSPDLFGDPDRMGSPNYSDGFDGVEIQDSGGVHSNSGVNNKAAFLLTDGGSFNGRTVAGLGNVKVGQLYYEVNANILSSGSDYQDLYDGLFQACFNLVALGRMVPSDCTQVRSATIAVEMYQQPHGTPGAFPSVPEAPMCGAGQVPNDVFYDNMEPAARNNWSRLTGLGSNRWVYDVGYAPSGRRMLYTQDTDTQSDASIVSTAATAIPSGRTTFVRFSQAMNFEAGFDENLNWVNADGGVVEYSANGGPWTDLGPLMTHNGYTGVISSAFGNPLGGRNAYVNATGGTFSTRADLSSLAGQSVKLRFRMGTDADNFSDSFWGWTVDDVRVYTCTPGSRPTPSATTNLLRNANFEWDDNDDGYVDNWTRNLGALRTRGAQKYGLYGLRFTAADNERYVVAQQVPVSAGKAYRASAWVNIPRTTNPVSFSVRVYYRNSANALLGTSVLRNYTTHTSGTWNGASIRTVAPKGARTATFAYLQNGLLATVLTDNPTFRLF